MFWICEFRCTMGWTCLRQGPEIISVQGPTNSSGKYGILGPQAVKKTRKIVSKSWSKQLQGIQNTMECVKISIWAKNNFNFSIEPSFRTFLYSNIHSTRVYSLWELRIGLKTHFSSKNPPKIDHFHIQTQLLLNKIFKKVGKILAL